MLLLAIAAHRVWSVIPDASAQVLDAKLPRALSLSRDLHYSTKGEVDARVRSSAAQLLGRVLLASGGEVDAEEVFRSALRTYAEVSRPHVRWLGGLDQGAMALHLNRPALAAQAYCAVADDPQADAAVRVEAMAGAAVAWHLTGEIRRSLAAVDVGRDLAQCSRLAPLAGLLGALKLELMALQAMRSSEQLSDHALNPLYAQGSESKLTRDEIGAALYEASTTPPCSGELVSRRLTFLSAAVRDGKSPLPATEWLHWLRSAGLRGVEPWARVESAMLQLGRHLQTVIAQTLGPDFDESSIRGQRYQLDLHYIHSKLAATAGRSGDALRHFSRHAAEAVNHAHSVARRSCSTRFLDGNGALQARLQDADCARLPLRYRRAYEFIVENLHDEALSVSQVACTLGVTERALQMAFRAHLGSTPAEVIRRKRAELVHEAITSQAGAVSLSDLASRHGLKSRATLASNYRARFEHSPSDTLRGLGSGRES